MFIGPPPRAFGMVQYKRQARQVFSETMPHLCEDVSFLGPSLGLGLQQRGYSPPASFPGPGLHQYASDSADTNDALSEAGAPSILVASPSSSTVSGDSPGTSGNASSPSTVEYPEYDPAVPIWKRQAMMAKLLLTSDDSLVETVETAEDWSPIVETEENDTDSQRSRSPKFTHPDSSIQRAIAAEEEKTKHYPLELIWDIQSTPTEVLGYAQELLSGRLYWHVKFGITESVKWRFFDCWSSTTGQLPHSEDWARMYIVYAAWGDECGILEKRLIETFKDNDKVQNINPGGEGAQPLKASFVYILANDLCDANFFGNRRARQRATARRQRENARRGR